MRPVIIESPYSSGTPISIPEVVARNEHYLNACLRDCLLQGEAPYASHGLYTRPDVLRDTLPEERKRGMEAGWEWLEVMSLAGFTSNTWKGLSAVYLDLGMSSGMERGIAKARGFGIEIEERRLGELWAECGTPFGLAGIACKAHSQSLGPQHAYSCPLWRVI
jgi:hypothetical protein